MDVDKDLERTLKGRPKTNVMYESKSYTSKIMVGYGARLLFLLLL